MSDKRQRDLNTGITIQALGMGWFMGFGVCSFTGGIADIEPPWAWVVAFFVGTFLPLGVGAGFIERAQEPPK